MSAPIGKSRVREIVMTETKTVAPLLQELSLSEDHAVLVNGERQDLNAILHENDTVIVLPIIAGG